MPALQRVLWIEKKKGCWSVLGDVPSIGPIQMPIRLSPEVKLI